MAFDPNVSTATRWKKGQSGNPGGRPKSALISKALRTQLAKAKPGDPKARTYAMLIAENLISIASEEAGSEAVHAAALIVDRLEGKVKQGIELGLAAEIHSKSDSELMFYLDNQRWPTPEELAQLKERDGLSDMDGGTTKIQ